MLRLLPLGLLLAAAASAQPAPTFADVPYHAVDGVDPALLSLDVYRPAGAGPFPVVVFVHGGGWHAGDKRSAVGAKADWLTGRGVMLVSVNYRLSPEPSASPAPDRLRFPTHPEDVGRAVALVAATAADWGGDPERIALMGHSAGAHLASLVATDGRYLAAAGAPAGVVGCAVALDTNAYDIPYFLGLGPGPSALATYVNAFTEDPAVQAAASPITYLGGPDPPPFLVVRQSTEVRAATAAHFLDALAEAGHTSEAYVAEGFSHSEINTRLGTASAPAYTSAVEAFLDPCLGQATTSRASPDAARPRIAPNPTTGPVRLALPPAPEPYVVTVRDVRGRRVLRVTTADGRLDLGGLAPGVYLLSARSGPDTVRQRVLVGR